MTLTLYKNLSFTVLKILKNVNRPTKAKENENDVAYALNITQEERNLIHKGTQTKLNNRIMWKLFYLKTKGYVENVGRGNYKIAEKGKTLLLKS